MWCVAICHDARDGAASRSNVFQAHVQHNIARMGAFVLTGPIANADGSTGIGDDPQLIGSLYCLDVEDIAAARAIMETDPFMNGVWGTIDYYEWQTPRGVWSSENARPQGLSAAYRCYIAAGQDLAHIEGALMSGAIKHLASTGPAPAPLAALAVLRADTIDAARAQAQGASWVASMPIAIGKLVKISSPADLPSPA